MNELWKCHAYEYRGEKKNRKNKMKKLLLTLGLLFFGCELTPELELTETSNQLSRTLPTQTSVVGEVFTYTW